MSRLLLEIYPERDGSTGALPPILIAAGDVPTPASGAIVLRLNNGSYALQRNGQRPDQPLNLGQWHEAAGWKLRISAAPQADAAMTVMDNPSWAAPEIRLTIQARDGVEKQLRCVLPIEEGSQLIVGRSSEHANLAVEDDHVSRRHVRFFTQNGRRYVEDLGSKWGTKLNNKALTDPVELKHGDELILGHTTIQYLCYWDILPEADSSQARSAVHEQLSARDDDLSPPSDAAAAAATEESPPPAPSRFVEEPEPEVWPAVPDPLQPKEKKKKPGKSWMRYLGFDIGGAILLALLALAALAYLGWKVFLNP